MTRIIPSGLDYTDRDFDSLKARMEGLIRTVFPDWTDFNTANFGNLLVELMAFVGDTLHFYQDGQANESFIPTLTQRLSMIYHSQLIGFTMSGASCATTDETFTLPFVNPTYALSIPAGTRVRSANPEAPVAFLTTTASSIPAGSLTVTVPIEQSERRSQSFLSTDEPNQSMVLLNTPFLDGSIDECDWDGLVLLAGVSAVNGDYTRVDSFLGYKSTDRVFIADVDQYDRCHIVFGNGNIGAIPQGEVQVAYKIGGGTAGNVEANMITVLDDPLFFADGAAASIEVTNPAAASGGADRMTIDEARVQAPASLRTLSRTVTKNDFETVARSVRGVARALMATSNEYAGIPENTGKLYIVGRGTKLSSGYIMPATPSSTLLAQVTAAINNSKPCTITFDHDELAAVFLTINVSTRVFLKYGAVGATVGGLIRDALNNFFAAQLDDGSDNETIDFGANLKDVNDAIIGELAWSDVFNAIRDIPGVRKVDENAGGLLLNNHSSSVTQLPIQFPLLGTVTIIDADTGDSL